MTIPIKYSCKDLIDELGKIGNKAQKIRNNLKAEMTSGDIRHVCLGGIQLNFEAIMLSYGAIECANQTIPNIDLKMVSCSQRTNAEQLDNFDIYTKTNLLISVHFKIESLFLNLLSTIDNTQSNKRNFGIITEELFNRVTLSSKDEKKNCLKIVSIIRNSFHNNTVNKNDDLDVTIKGKRFILLKDQNTTATIFDIIFLVDYTVEIIGELINSPEVLVLPDVILDQFHLNLI